MDHPITSSKIIMIYDKDNITLVPNDLCAINYQMTE